MNKILLASHGPLANGMKKTAEFLMGQNENVSLLKKGWKKGVVLQADVIKAAMDDAAHYSSDNCLREGGFGFKNQIEE